MSSRSTFTTLKLACVFTAAALASGAVDAAPGPNQSLTMNGARGASHPTRPFYVVMVNGQRIRTIKWVCVGCAVTPGPGHPSDGMITQGSSSPSVTGSTSLSPGN